MVSFGKFFSIEGQKKRLANVVNVFKSIPSGTVQANVKSKTLKTGLEFVANNPLTAAGLATPVGLAGKSIAAKGIKATVSKIASKVGALPLKAKVGAAFAAPAAAVVAANVPTSTLIKVAGGVTPEAGGRLVADVISAVKGKKSVKDIIKENPIGIGIIAAGAALVGAKALPQVAGLIQGQRQLQATKNVEKALTANPIPITASPAASPITYTVPNPLQDAAVGEEPDQVQAIPKQQPKITNKQEINIGNFIKNKRYQRKYATSKRTKRTKRK